MADGPVLETGRMDQTNVGETAIENDASQDVNWIDASSEKRALLMDRFVMDVSGFDDYFFSEDAGLSEDAHDGTVPRIITHGYMTCALTSAGSVYCWGISRYLNSVGTESEQELPRRVGGLRNIVQLAMSLTMACAVDSDRSVWCWGQNMLDHLQTGSTEDPLTVARRRLDVSDIVQVAPFGPAFLGRYLDGSIVGRDGSPSVLVRFPLPAPAVDLRATTNYCTVLSTGVVACYTAGVLSRVRFLLSAA